MKKLAIIALAAVAGGASAVELYNNGAVTNSTNGGVAISTLPAEGAVFGQSATMAFEHQIADNFTVTGPGWRLTSISFYAFQITATPTFSFSSMNASIVTGDDPGAGVQMFGTSTTNLVNEGIVGYRVREATPANRTRAIYKITLNNLNVLLLPGVHTLRWSIDGAEEGQWIPPVVPLTYTNGTGWQKLSTLPWEAALDTGFQPARRMEFPFQLQGEVVPEPATMIALGAGIAAIAARRRRK